MKNDETKLYIGDVVVYDPEQEDKDYVQVAVFAKDIKEAAEKVEKELGEYLIYIERLGMDFGSEIITLS